ncbi:hypothetical protein AQUCO_00200993v1 [Aquilegia coerulea]|uniref:Uncharacterized protein n=1 Tax=Aquilegia coerulea TaxID=218851 RepID=A0A2G5F5Y4_AQUCA|nr:hypothetical protein AQUCO_00200993v1 [Aquilegia coerulea]
MMASTSIPSSSSGSKIPLSSTIPNKPTSQQQQQQGCVVIKDDVEMSEKMVGDDNQLEAEDRGKLDMGENFFEDTETAQKFEKYQADYARYLRAKYFSGKNLYGGNIYEEVRVNNMTIKASRWPCTRSFTHPIESFEGPSKLSASTTKAPMSVPSRKKCSN